MGIIDMWRKLLALGAALSPIPALAAPALDVSGIVDLKGAVADGEQSWNEGSFGKLRFGGDANGDANADVTFTGALVLKSRLAWDVDAYAHIEVDPQHDAPLGLAEGYLRWKPMAWGTRFQVRAGAFYPPISLEHDGPGWRTTRTLTPSAINSWVGEEVKVAGVEAGATRQTMIGDLSAGLALFGFNDTAGTLLTFRGWALHDRQSTVGGDFPLPEFSDEWWEMRAPQVRRAQPFLEVDNRAGYYARAEWRPDFAPIAVDLLRYDNNGDRSSDREEGQTSWDTRFWSLGARAAPVEGVEILAQAMTGSSVWIDLGGAGPGIYVDDIDFRAAYVLVDKTLGESGVALRLDVFETDDNQTGNLVATPEDGIAFTAAWRVPVFDRASLFIEGVHVESERAARTLLGDEPSQSQTSVQAAFRFAF
jgi:hypothetical protein